MKFGKFEIDLIPLIIIVIGIIAIADAATVLFSPCG